MRRRYYCEVIIHPKHSAESVVVQRICKSKTEANELANWIHKQFISAPSSRILTIELPSIRNQAPQTISLRPCDICAVKTVVDSCESMPETVITGFQVPSEADAVKEHKADFRENPAAVATEQFYDRGR